jgi:hypothetical protein
MIQKIKIGYRIAGVSIEQYSNITSSTEIRCHAVKL